MSTPTELIKKYDIKAKKNLGQNFLIEPSIIDKIVKLLEIDYKDTILEIGPGLGALTYRLTEFPNRLIAIEKDSSLYEILQLEFNDKKNVEIINQDILKIDLAKLAKGKIKIVGNLPYNISSPIIFWMIKFREHIDTATIMLQKEVGRRLTAPSGNKDYGILSVICQAWADCKMCFNIPPSCFNPPPKVTSSIVKLKFRKPSIDLKDPVLFERVVSSAFGKRRKTIVNSIKSSNLEISETALLSALKGLGISEKSRAEVLSSKQFIELTNALSDLDKRNAC
ncbi:MAG: 16S rRNA (adenine(1518)-N(6)/adenine(1519)-N(6))-dimethyltransferase RsmA [Pseudomonadota bacterium]